MSWYSFFNLFFGLGWLSYKLVGKKTPTERRIMYEDAVKPLRGRYALKAFANKADVESTVSNIFRADPERKEECMAFLSENREYVAQSSDRMVEAAQFSNCLKVGAGYNHGIITLQGRAYTMAGYGFCFTCHAPMPHTSSWEYDEFRCGNCSGKDFEMFTSDTGPENVAKYEKSMSSGKSEASVQELKEKVHAFRAVEDDFDAAPQPRRSVNRWS